MMYHAMDVVHSPRQTCRQVPSHSRQVCRGLLTRYAYRRGGAYIAVLGAAVLVTIIGLSAIAAVRLQSQAARTTANLAQARRHARSAIELARKWIADNPGTWRDDAAAATGKWGENIPFAGGTMKVQVTDPRDGDLTDDPDDLVMIQGTGMVGRARQRLAAMFEPQMRYPIFETSVVCGTSAVHDLKIEGGRLIADHPVHVADDVEVTNGGELWADVVAGDDIDTSDGTHHGQSKPGTPMLGLPNPDAVLNPYVSMGTKVSLASLPTDSVGRHTLRGVVLTPTHNPFGPANAKGIYTIDCSFDPILIEDCRIIGTLVLIDPDNDSKVRGSVSWRPAKTNLPALVTDDVITIGTDHTIALTETAAGANLNPSGAGYPYDRASPDTASDADQTDSYPSIIQGMIYSADDLVFAGNTLIVGPVFTDEEITIAGGRTLDLRYRARYVEEPPPGFEGAEREMRLLPRSWRWVVD